MPSYMDFLEGKVACSNPVGFEAGPMPDKLFDWQQAIVRWACRRGKACIFADCGLGKTAMQLEWARQVSASTGGAALVLAPLAVAQQTRSEGEKFGIPVEVVRSMPDDPSGVYVTNYEMSGHFDLSSFAGVVLDESSVIKSHDSKTRTDLTDKLASVPYVLCCTATPAPNDQMEFGTHAEICGAMTRAEMLATFFTHEGGDTSKWRLKGHASADFYKWMATWAVMISSPSDIGYSEDGYVLPELNVVEVEVDAPDPEPDDGRLFAVPTDGIQQARRARRDGMPYKVAAIADKVNSTPGQWCVWCELNDESSALAGAIPDAVEVRGSDSPEHKADAMLGFAEGRYRVIVSKPSICGFGMNWQNCHQMAFCGLSYSYEQFYQATRRCWRFGQMNDVDVFVFSTRMEQGVVDAVMKKERMVEETKARMIEAMADETERQLIVFSPPFASLYTYSDSVRDMGNSRTDDEFWEHFSFLIPELLRVVMPGRSVCIHCMNLPLTKERDGVIGIRDFRGDIIRAFERAGFVYHSEVCIWKNPVTAMQRTKAMGLLHKTIRKDSSMSRMGIPDYVVVMRKPGKNPEPISHAPDEFPMVPNLGDITKIDWKDAKRVFGAVDLVVGGSPCQSFSIAGNRTGLEGESGLMWEYVRAVRGLMPRWILWENVPGALSSSNGEDFRCLLGALDELGYGLAWRVLDAQFFGVAQRRRRLFLVGCLGDGGAERACEVLFEPESLPWNTPSSREKRKELAARAGSGSEATGFQWNSGGNTGLSIGESSPTVVSSAPPAVCAGFKYHQVSGAGSIGYEAEQSPTVTADYHNPAVICMAGQQPNSMVSSEVCGTLTAHEARGGSYVAQGFTVRRLTPKECERLQGFPDDWTKIPYRGKPADECPDTPRYKAIGNSMAVPVMRWIAERIQEVDECQSR